KSFKLLPIGKRSMQKGKTLSLCLLAAMLWNCNEATSPEKAGTDPASVPATIDALAKKAAVQAGYSISPPNDEGPDLGDAFSAEALTAMRDAGLCDNFVKLVEEISQNEDALAGPRFKNVVTCLTDKVESITAQSSESAIMGIVEDCFCAGSGSLFAGFGNFAFSTYSAPSSAGGSTYSAPSTSSSGYSAPQSSS